MQSGTNFYYTEKELLYVATLGIYAERAKPCSAAVIYNVFSFLQQSLQSAGRTRLSFFFLDFLEKNGS